MMSVSTILEAWILNHLSSDVTIDRSHIVRSHVFHGIVDYKHKGKIPEKRGGTCYVWVPVTCLGQQSLKAYPPAMTLGMVKLRMTQRLGPGKRSHQMRMARILVVGSRLAKRTQAMKIADSTRRRKVLGSLGRGVSQRRRDARLLELRSPCLNLFVALASFNESQ